MAGLLRTFFGRKAPEQAGLQSRSQGRKFWNLPHEPACAQSSAQPTASCTLLRGAVPNEGRAGMCWASTPWEHRERYCAALWTPKVSAPCRKPWHLRWNLPPRCCPACRQVRAAAAREGSTGNVSFLAAALQTCLLLIDKCGIMTTFCQQPKDC